MVYLGLLGGASAAWAGVGALAVPTFPSSVTVGQTGVGASITIARFNTTPNTGDTNVVCNIGDPNGCGGVLNRGIVLVPTCKELVTGDCPSSGADPGVFRISSTAVGTAGQCLGVNFTTLELGDSFGTVRFTPTGGAHVTLSSNADTCEIGFTFDVLKSPTGDQDPDTPGAQTGQSSQHVQCVSPCGPGNLSNNAQGTANGTTVVRASPTITTLASPDIPTGGQLTDQATVTGLVAPVAAGATVTFRLYPPSASTCTGTPVFESVKPVVISGTTATATSDAYTATQPGVYHWVATYSGDVNNLGVAGACGEATETRTVTTPTTPPPPPGVTPPPPPPAVCTPPPGPPPPGGVLCRVAPTVCTTPPGPAPAGGELCARGTAAIRGRTGCAGTAFNVVVSGRQIQRVVFSLDGKVVRSLTKPNSGSRYTLKVNPRTMRIGVHRVLARTTFRSQSGTRARTLRVTFSRCARRAVSPAFTG